MFLLFSYPSLLFRLRVRSRGLKKAVLMWVERGQEGNLRKERGEKYITMGNRDKIGVQVETSH